MVSMDSPTTFACPDDDCTYTVASDDVDEIVDLAQDHASTGHGEQLERRTVLWQMRTGPGGTP